MTKFEPISITGIIEAKVSQPRNDGTPGASLYNVAFKLSNYPPTGWDDMFEEAWNHPSSFTTSHRPGICSVVGDEVWLNGTTLDEVARVHKETLELALAEANRQYAQFDRQRQLEIESKLAATKAHEDHIREEAKKIKF